MHLRSSLRLVVAGVAVGAVAAGCGAGQGKPYTARATAPCLKKSGFTGVTMDPGKVGFIAGFADNGGLKATARDGNVVTIAFTADASSVGDTERAFRNHAQGIYKRRIRDVMETQGNAVLVWTKTPGQNQLSTTLACLRS